MISAKHKTNVRYQNVKPIKPKHFLKKTLSGQHKSSLIRYSIFPWQKFTPLFRLMPISLRANLPENV